MGGWGTEVEPIDPVLDHLTKGLVSALRKGQIQDTPEQSIALTDIRQTLGEQLLETVFNRLGHSIRPTLRIAAGQHALKTVGRVKIDLDAVVSQLLAETAKITEKTITLQKWAG